MYKRQVCTFTNTRTRGEAPAALTLQKTWVRGRPGDQVVLTATRAGGGGSAFVEATAGAPGGASPNRGDLRPGDEVTVVESFTAGDAGAYDTVWVCSGLGSAGRGAGPAFTFTVPEDPGDVACDASNTRREAKLTLRKRWVDGEAGDAATLTVAGGESGSGSAVSTARGAGEETDAVNVVVRRVYVGETVTLSEEAGGGYAAGLGCSDGAGALSYEAGAAAGSLVVGSGASDVVCTFTNTGDPGSEGPVGRLWGAGRYSTAVRISEAAFSPGVERVYVATGENFPDALAGGAASGGEGPILLVRKDVIPSATVNELRRLKPKRIVVLGLSLIHI